MPSWLGLPRKRFILYGLPREIKHFTHSNELNKPVMVCWAFKWSRSGSHRGQDTSESITKEQKRSHVSCWCWFWWMLLMKMLISFSRLALALTAWTTKSWFKDHMLDWPVNPQQNPWWDTIDNSKAEDSRQQQHRRAEGLGFHKLYGIIITQQKINKRLIHICL